MLYCSYNPHKNNTGDYLKALSDFLDSNSEKVLTLGDLNVEVDEQNMKSIEPVPQRCSVKNMFLEISQNLQGNTWGRVSLLIKLQA